MMYIDEAFTTCQGEGPHAGRLCTIVRLHGCNLRCTGCDTPHDMEYQSISTDDLAQRIKALPSKLVVITGGEPCLQAAEVLELVSKLIPCGYSMTMETNGTIYPGYELVSLLEFVVLSPKKQAGISSLWLTFPSDNIVMKYVVGDGEWCWTKEELKLRRKMGSSAIPLSRVWVMPEGASEDKLRQTCKAVWELAIEFGVNYSDRLHIRSGGK